MTWREKMRRGSFRGVAFYTNAVDDEVGRRVAVHEYPGRDNPYPEDMGRKARGFTVECYVSGPEYMADRDALIAAVEKKGPGKLVHPFWGEFNVQAINARIREGSGEEGVARFAITFVESGQNEFPVSSTNTATLVASNADVGLMATADDFADRFSVSGVPQFVTQGAESIFSGGIDQLTALSSFNGDLSGLALPALIQKPLDLANTIIDAVRQIQDVFDLRSVAAFGSSLPAVTANTITRKRQAENQSAAVSLFNRSATIEMASRMVDSQLVLDNKQSAISYRNELADRLDEISATASDPVFDAMQGLRAAVVRDANQRLAQLPAVVTYDTPETMPALALAYRLYGDIEKETEIINRNRIRHGGFVAGEIEYLK